MEFREMTAAEIGQKIKTGEMTAVDAVKAALAEIKKQDEVLNSFVTVDEEGALKTEYPGRSGGSRRCPHTPGSSVSDFG